MTAAMGVALLQGGRGWDEKRFACSALLGQMPGLSMSTIFSAAILAVAWLS